MLKCCLPFYILSFSSVVVFLTFRGDFEYTFVGARVWERKVPSCNERVNFVHKIEKGEETY